MVLSPIVHEALWNQFGAAIDTLGDAIDALVHAAQINLVLRQWIDAAPPWVGRARRYAP